MPPSRHPDRPKRSRDPFKAAHEVFQEVIGEKPRTTPKAKKATPPGKPDLPIRKSST
jgi:hypothetical protein